MEVEFSIVRKGTKAVLFRNNPSLLEALREGQRRVLDVVYQAYAPSVRRYLLGLTHATKRSELAQASTIDDLMQEVFTRAFSRAGRTGYDGARPYGPYLFGICHKCVADLRRKHAREVAMPQEQVYLICDGIEVELPSAQDPHVSRVLGAFFVNLPALYQAVLEQRFLLERPQVEVSTLLKLTRKELRTIEGRLVTGVRRELVRAGVWQECSFALAARPAS